MRRFHSSAATTVAWLGSVLTAAAMGNGPHPTVPYGLPASTVEAPSINFAGFIPDLLAFAILPLLGILCAGLYIATGVVFICVISGRFGR